ncbi:L-aspartate oxidase [Ruminiclostridium sufflavum DSM 19573]|uniref:L-aspartate oxidase n=1 Tax=Ruminiclostridium sufflavum DSM 19573 TaxID=1121337 RepID=A0A318XTB8_9FIRM|nr:L-aspartate oxidase [Ruminiclostridium sufflavum]PYG85034.1 L-aspartate oxidase [Ruminiclostridium sufflavum DSM 19573]
MEEDTKKLNVEVIDKDVVIVGSGIAGVYTALELPENYQIGIITKETLDISNSVLAQGGIAVSLDEKNDSPALHFKDTLFAGAGLCDQKSVWVLVEEAAENIKKLCKLGVNFDKSGRSLSLTREGAHSVNRIIHSGDTTGKEVCDTLIGVAQKKQNISIYERYFAVDLIVKSGKCSGVIVYDEIENNIKIFRANSVVIATGGFGQIYSHTTNPEVATGDGIGMCLRAGAEAMDMEFIQFHPTVLYHHKDKSFLISEAVRGEGAYLKNDKDERFMHKYDSLGELAPRDVVSRAIFKEMALSGKKNVFLDITFQSREHLEERFPNIFKTCFEYGIDMSKEYIPVAPAEHYCMGGIRTDVDGQTNIRSLFACGEVACTGIHGANRLASNSLLEGLVFGRKIARRISSEDNEKNEKDITIAAEYSLSLENEEIFKNMKQEIQETMTRYVGIIRDEQGLTKAAGIINNIYQKYLKLTGFSLIKLEVANMLIVARLVIESALERKESRGAHYRSDFDKSDDVNWKRNLIKVLDGGVK